MDGFATLLEENNCDSPDKGCQNGKKIAKIGRGCPVQRAYPESFVIEVYSIYELQARLQIHSEDCHLER
jgi:hypothetical protein